MASTERPRERRRPLRLDGWAAPYSFLRFLGASLHRPLLAALLPCLMVACGGQSCSGCDGPLTQPTAPDQLMLPVASQVRITQHGFDVIAAKMVALLKAVLGAGAGGQAVQSMNIACGFPETAGLV